MVQELFRTVLQWFSKNPQCKKAVKVNNIDFSGVASILCTWCCTDDISGSIVPHGHFLLTILIEKYKIFKTGIYLQNCIKNRFKTA